jgi:hypothetical protein
MMSVMSRPSGEITFAVEEAPEGGYLARALGHDIFTEADSPEGLREAVRCHFDEDDRPKMIHLHFVREEVFAAADAELLSGGLAPICFSEWASEADTSGYAALSPLRRGDGSGDN